jgi:hypothetical protein
MDFKEFNKPVRAYLDEPIDLDLNSEVLTVADIHIAPAKTELIDHIFKYWEKVSYKFAHVKNVKTATKKQRTANANLVASVVVSLDRCMFYYGRHADTVFEGLEQIGGFYESIHFIGFIFVFFFSHRLFVSEFINSLYYVQSPKEDESGFNSKEMYAQAETKIVEDDSFVKKVLEYVTLRKPFKYGYRDIIDYLFKFKCFRIKSKNNWTYFDKGKQMLA